MDEVLKHALVLSDPDTFFKSQNCRKRAARQLTVDACGSWMRGNSVWRAGDGGGAGHRLPERNHFEHNPIPNQ
jgi:hypothetical protein